MRHVILAVAFAASALTASARPTLAEDTQGARSAPAAANEDIWRTILPSQDVYSVLGKDVRNDGGENLGRIVDVLVERGGQVRAVVIDFGGFLGVGARRLVVDWGALRLDPERITANITRDQARVAPEYKPGKSIFVLGEPKE